jgi:hypothetical protein
MKEAIIRAGLFCFGLVLGCVAGWCVKDQLTIQGKD